MNRKIYSLIIVLVPLLFFSLMGVVLAGTTILDVSDYKSLGFRNITGSGIEFSDFLRGIIKFSLGGGVLLAIVLLIKGGVEYVTVDTFAGKENGRETIRNALLGLILLFISFLILKLINPALISGENLKIAKIKASAAYECSVIKTSDGYEPIHQWEDKYPAWSVGGGNYWDIKNGECIANKEQCRDAAIPINKQEGRDAKNVSWYAMCLGCPVMNTNNPDDYKGELKNGCEKIYSDDEVGGGSNGSNSPEGMRSVSDKFDPKYDQVYLAVCEGYYVPYPVVGGSMVENDCSKGEDDGSNTFKKFICNKKFTRNYPEETVEDRRKHALSDCNDKKNKETKPIIRGCEEVTMTFINTDGVSQSGWGTKYCYTIPWQPR